MIELRGEAAFDLAGIVNEPGAKRARLIFCRRNLLPVDRPAFAEPDDQAGAVAQFGQVGHVDQVPHDIQRRALRPDLDTSPDRPRRWFRIKDASEGGVRLVVEEKDWQPVEVGDLVAFAGVGDGAIVVGEVVRKIPDAEPGCVQLGVASLTPRP